MYIYQSKVVTSHFSTELTVIIIYYNDNIASKIILILI